MKTKAFLILTMTLGMICNQFRAQSISDLLNGYFAYNRFWGNVLVMQNGKTIYQNSYGFADREKNIRNDEETLFYLASVTKTVTATAIFKLHDEGKLSVYDRVDRYVPGFIDDKTDSLTILNLLNHTSGMAANIAQSDDFSKEVPFHPSKDIVKMEQLIDGFRGTKLKSKPGVSYNYNNYGYVLLAYIIEKVSGMDYLSYLKREIFPEAGMTETSDQKNLPRQPAVGYFGIGSDSIYPAKEEIDLSAVKGATGLYSSASDLSKFVRSVFSCDIFSRQTLDQMTDTCISIHKGDVFWTAGWQKENIDGHDFFSHGGSKEGYSTLVGYIPDDDISIVVLSNLVRDFTTLGQSSVNFSFVGQITRDIIGIVHGRSVTCLPLPIKNVSGKISGNYRLDDNHYMNVTRKDGSLFLSSGPDSGFSVFDYNLYRDAIDSSRNYMVCKKFISAILENNYDVFERDAKDALQNSVFDNKLFTLVKNFWDRVNSNDGKYISSNICEKTVKPYGADFMIACHFEKSEMIMQMSFNDIDHGIINGFYILKMLPKCNVNTVSLIPVGKDEYFVDGFRYGGYKDFKVSYDRKSRTLSFKSDDGNYTALRTDQK